MDEIPKMSISANELIRQLRKQKESITDHMVVVPDNLKGRMAEDLIDIQESLVSEYVTWIGMALDEIDNPSPGWRKYVGNCQREAAHILEMIDKISFGLKVCFEQDRLELEGGDKK